MPESANATSSAADATAIGRRRWVILGLGLAAQTASCSFLYGLPFLVPTMQRDAGLSLAGAGTVVAAPSIGLLLTLIAWGAAADRFGERLIMAGGLGLSGLLLVWAALGGHGLGLLFTLFLLAGAATASVNAASGRVVMGWFARDQRGVAMGIRQTAQPLGVGVAALGLPPLAEHVGFAAAMLLPAALALVVAALVALFVLDPPRPPRTGDTGERPRSPYRSPALWRLHGASSLLVVPQFAVSVFAPVFLVTTRGWSPLAAGWFLAVAQGLGALGRLGSGFWSDRVGNRLGPMRLLACAAVLSMGLVALGITLDAVGPLLAALLLAAVITVADNGLGFTASAEFAGSAWAGRAMGAQNTTQNIAAALTPPLLGLFIGATDFAAAFLLVAVFPVLAIGLVPVRAERRTLAMSTSD